MPERIDEPFCPLYSTARSSKPWKSSESAHAGLLFDKFAYGWRYRLDRDARIPEFDKGAGRNKEGANDWINSFRRECGEPASLDEACVRQRRLVERLGGRVINLKNTERFVTGMGREHPLENGFAWHHTLGVPYLSGSSVKGLLRAWLREENGEVTTDRHGNDAWEETPEHKQLFGTLGDVGQVILLDMLPTKPPQLDKPQQHDKPPQLDVDVMTPHYGDYYQKGAIPGDWHSPVPISFLTVAPGWSWQLGIIPATGHRALEAGTLDSLSDSLFDAIQICGAGAKTAVGYGRFEKDTATEKQFRQQQAEREQREAATRQHAVEEAAFKASMTADSEPLQQLKTLRRKQNWVLTASNQMMLQALHEFADQYADPPRDCLDWIHELLESIPNYKGVWNNVEARKGKNGDKPKYNAEAIRTLVRKLNPPSPGN